MPLHFKPITKSEDFKAIHDYIADVFSDTDFNWTLDQIRGETKAGCELWAAYSQEDVVAALFLRMDGDTLLTKNSALNIHHQGQGHSHEIKEYFEQVARQRGAKKISHFCRIDNFRAYSLNESHNYTRLEGKNKGDDQVVEWRKKIK